MKDVRSKLLQTTYGHVHCSICRLFLLTLGFYLDHFKNYVDDDDDDIRPLVVKIIFGVSESEEGWPSGTMSDCNAKVHEFESWWGKK